MVLIAERDDEVADDHDQDVGDHGRQSHLRFADTSVLHSGAHADPIAQRPGSYKADDGTNEDGKVHEANGFGGEVVGGCGKDLRLGKVEGEEGGGAPRDDKGGEFNDGEGKEFPGDPEV